MTITADDVRRLIVTHDADRPRSKQTALGPSSLASPCARQIGYGALQVPPAVSTDVNLYAYVGTGLHSQLEWACKADNARLGRTRWLTEKRVSVPVTDAVTVTGSLDAYDHDTYTVVDWKGRGASKPSAATRDKHHGQLGWYALGAILAGLVVDRQAVAYIPRNGTLSEIEVDARPVDMDAVEAAIRRYESILSATAAGPAVLPLLPTEHDCRFCNWWNPGAAWADPSGIQAGCPGHPQTTGTTPEEHNTTQHKEEETQL